VPDISKLEIGDNKENVPPPRLVTPEKAKFASPGPATASSSSQSVVDQREPLSPKKGVAVNTKHMPAYMRATASSSGRKTITTKPVFGQNKPSAAPAARPGLSRPSSATAAASARSSSSRPSSAMAGGARGQKGSSIPRPKSSIPSNRVAPKKKLTSQTASSSSLSKTSIPKQQLPRPQSSAASSINATSSTKNKTFDSARWSRLATPKSVVSKAKTETRKTVVTKPVITKSVATTKKKEILVKPKVTKKVQAPKTPEPTKTTRPIIESQLGQKSCPRELKEKKRRRTRFSVNTEELKQNLDEWRQTDVGKMDQKQLWNSLSQEDSKSKTATEVLIAIDQMCKDMSTFKIPHDEKMKIMLELPQKFPFVDIKLFASYWKWYAEIGIKCGLPQEDIIDIIQQGKKTGAQPMRTLSDFFDDYMGRIVDNPDLGQGLRAADPDVSMFNFIADDEDLELSVVFDPHSRADGSEPSTIESIKSIPSIKEELSSELEEHDANGKEADVKQEPLSPIVDQQTLMMRTIIENNESNHDDSGSYFKFVVRKKKTNNVILTPVRRSKRTQNTTSAQKAVKEMKEGETIELTEVVDSKTGEAVNDDVIIII